MTLIRKTQTGTRGPCNEQHPKAGFSLLSRPKVAVLFKMYKKHSANGKLNGLPLDDTDKECEQERKEAKKQVIKK